MIARAALLLAAAARLAAPAPADVLVLKDGRFVEGRPVAKVEAGFKIAYPSGEVLVPAVMVADYFTDAGADTYEPTTPEEKEMWAKGLAPWKGQWVSKERRAKLLAAEVEARRKRVDQQQARREWRNHVEVKTKRFVFRHTLPDDIFAQFQDLFEAYYEYFTKFWRIRPGPKFGTPEIHIYHDYESFLQRSGAPRGVVGWYSPATRELHFFYDRERVQFAIDVMFHEGNHMLAHMVDERFWYPWWIGEGLAEYFGASRWDPETKTMSTGHLQSARLAVLHVDIEDNKRWLALDDLIRSDGLGAVEYAWAWSFCHFLLSTERYAENFRKHFLNLARSNAVPKVPAPIPLFRTVAPDARVEALLRDLKVRKLETLQQEWYDYIRTHLTMARADVDYESAGWMMELYGERRRARDMFKKAIENGSKSAYVHYGYAKLLFGRNKVDAALEHAERAVELDPLHARARALVGSCHVSKGNTEEGNRLLKLAREIDPDDPELWLAAEFAKRLQKDDRSDGGE
jgi:hypothetical protein